MARKFTMVPVDVAPVKQIPGDQHTGSHRRQWLTWKRCRGLNLFPCRGSRRDMDRAMGVNVYDASGNCWLDFFFRSGCHQLRPL